MRAPAQDHGSGLKFVAHASTSNPRSLRPMKAVSLWQDGHAQNGTNTLTRHRCLPYPPQFCMLASALASPVHLEQTDFRQGGPRAGKAATHH